MPVSHTEDRWSPAERQHIVFRSPADQSLLWALTLTLREQRWPEALAYTIEQDPSLPRGATSTSTFGPVSDETLQRFDAIVAGVLG